MNEIFESIRTHPKRTILTSLGIVWGMFILVLLIGIGKGFESSVYSLFGGFSKGTTYALASETSIGYESTPIGTPVRFMERDLSLLKSAVPQISDISPEVSEIRTCFHENEFGSFEVRGVYPDYFNIRLLKVSKGRLLNHLDYLNTRKTVIIGDNVASVLFNTMDPIGKWIRIGNDSFLVVGIIENNLFSTYESRVVYLPFSTFLQTNNEVREFPTIVFSTDDYLNFRSINRQINGFMSRWHHFSPKDEKVFYFNSMEEQIETFSSFFDSLKKFLWFLGISTLLSGIIGVGNNMYTVTKERTKEIAIRKAVGATSRSIKSLFLCESIIVTSISGTIGVFAGWIVLKIIGLIISESSVMLDNPTINLPTVFAALILLIISGTIAGLRPAIQASELTPIEALNEMD